MKQKKYLHIAWTLLYQIMGYPQSEFYTRGGSGGFQKK